MILPLDSDLTLEEMGLLTTMLNVVEADYTSIEGLVKLSSNSKEKVFATLSALIGKGYVLSFGDKYCVNKQTIPVMMIKR